MKDLPEDKRRITKIQIRGNFQQTSDEVTEGVPAAFHPLPNDLPPNRLALAKWLIDEKNPASQNLAKKLGAMNEQQNAVINDKPCDIWRHLPKDEFLARYS